MALQDANIILIERFLDYCSGMFWIVVMLELPIVAKLELLWSFLHVFIKDLDIFLLSHDSWIHTGFSKPRKVKHSLIRMYAWSHCMMYT